MIVCVWCHSYIIIIYTQAEPLSRSSLHSEDSTSEVASIASDNGEGVLPTKSKVVGS